MLILEKLWKTYDDVTALADVSVKLPESSYTVVVGQSGSGKSTLLRAIAGHVAIDSGSITLSGQEVSSLPAWQRPVASVFQNYALFPHLTVAQNIAFGLEQQKIHLDQIRTIVADMLDLVGLINVEKRRPSELSGGQQQRVALARALAVQPSAVLLDEPLGALDPTLRATMRQELARVQRESGVLFLHVSHDREEAWTLATHLLVMHDGRLVGNGAIDELYETPGNAHVAHMLGYDIVMPHPQFPGTYIAFAPERVLIGTGEWHGKVVSLSQFGAYIERNIRLETGELIRQREIAEMDTNAWLPGADVSIHIPLDAIRVLG